MLEKFRQHYTADPISKEDVFYYVYAILHHPEYRERYAANLKRELPRIPFAPNFRAFADAGRELARLHVEYECLEPWPLTFVEDKSVPYSERVVKMKLSADRRSVKVNESLTLDGIPPETFDYRARKSHADQLRSLSRRGGGEGAVQGRHGHCFPKSQFQIGCVVH